ncbi:MAG: amidohydrolase family protein, partial [Micrococcales bacterium]|nr:amidohydrolase family protein [Micrococcales bacterium]
SAESVIDRVDEIIDLDGAIVTPGFVDTHIDLLATGLAMSHSPDEPLDDQVRASACRRALRHAAAHGIVAVHDMAHPSHDTLERLHASMEATEDPTSGFPQVIGYWGGLCDDEAAEAAVEQVPRLAGLWAAVDGSFADHTAWLHDPYPAADGHGLLTAAQVCAHVVAATRAGVQASVWAAGDAALDEVLDGMFQAAQILGTAAVAGARHRVEHLGLAGTDALAQMAKLAMTASVQPSCEAAWGEVARAHLGDQVASLFPVADLARAGIPTGFGSASPLAPLDPWIGVRAGLFHHDPDQRVSARSAFRSATRGGWRLSGGDWTGAGELRVGAPAHLAVWRADDLVVQSPDGAVNAWSTDARAGTPMLPSLAPGATPPVCLRTVRSGITLYDTFE